MDRFEVLVTTFSRPPAAIPPSAWGPLSTMSGSRSRLGTVRIVHTHMAPAGAKPEPAVPPVAVMASPRLMAELGLTATQPCGLEFGLRRALVWFQPEPALATDQLPISPALAEQLQVPTPLRLTVYRRGQAGLALGPLIAVLISQAKLRSLLEDGKLDTVYCRFAHYAREVGAVLFFFTTRDLTADHTGIAGYQLQSDQQGGWRWGQCHFPIPRVVYDRCFGKEGRAEAAQIRTLARELGLSVVNTPQKITKRQAFDLLEGYPELAVHLPYTAPLTSESLATALAAYPDLYLKPNALYKGQGVLRLTREGTGWWLRSREDWGNASQFLANRDELTAALAPFLEPGADYVLQEGLALATYLGNRFDFRSLTQKDGRGDWAVTGLVARIAPVGSVITSPRSGGYVAPADRVLRHAFGDRWTQVLADIEGVSVELARRVDRHLGVCTELGLDLGVTSNGTVKLIEVNGKPLKVSLQRLHDPLVTESINRYPIHFAAALAGAGGMIRCNG